jgi:hypothetical protein
MQLAKIFKSGIVSSVILALSIGQIAAPALAGNVDIDEDKLNPDRGLKWGGESLPLDSLVTIRDSLVNSSVGKLTIDRHGEDNGDGLALLFKSPFAGPRPGRMTIVTLWGSKEEGCFVKALVHSAPKSGSQDPKSMVPVKLEIGLGTQVVKLNPIAKNAAAKLSSGSYSYQDGDVEKRANMYYTENTFAVNAKVADLFRNAPKANAKVRITFLDNSTNVFEVGSGNVSRWRDSYGFNPTCSSR